jgi:hypothetical protein
VRWHRAGFRRYWRWKSRRQGGRPIQGELLKLGFSVAQSTVAKYMVKRLQGWKTFLRNHASDIAAMDLFVVPTIGFKLLYGLVIVRIDRRDLVWINVTANPTAEWIAQQAQAIQTRSNPIRQTPPKLHGLRQARRHCNLDQIVKLSPRPSKHSKPRYPGQLEQLIERSPGRVPSWIGKGKQSPNSKRSSSSASELVIFG